jgi:pimeloyl-ACP methyl ester carboxylesterase
MMKTQRCDYDTALLRAQFDADWYLLHYADVKAAAVDPWRHFEQHGYAEGRLPCSLAAYPYVVKQKWPLATKQLSELERYAVESGLNGALASYLLSLHFMSVEQWHKAAQWLPAFDRCQLLSLVLKQAGPVVLHSLLNVQYTSAAAVSCNLTSSEGEASNSAALTAAALIRQLFCCAEVSRASVIHSYWTSPQKPVSPPQRLNVLAKLRQLMRLNTPAVTVVVPLLNAETSLPLLLSCVLDNAAFIAEILLVVAVSSDQTLALAAHWASKVEKIKLLHNADIRTLDQARALGITQAKTSMVLLHDQELWCSATRLECMLGAFTAQPKAQVAVTRVLLLSRELLPVCKLPRLLNDTEEMEAVLVRSKLLQQLKSLASTGELSAAHLATLIKASGKATKIVACPQAYLAIRYAASTEFSSTMLAFVQLQQAESFRLNQPLMGPSGKTSLQQLQDLDRVQYGGQLAHINRTSLYYFEDNGLHYDFLWRPKTQSKKLFVFFSGDAMRKKYNPPVFQRQSWAGRVPGHCLFISDPLLYIDSSLGLAWYCGTELQDPLLRISELIRQITAELGLSLADVVAYGSSGGGYAALRLSLLLPDIAVICINPQTDISVYETRGVERYLRLCWQGISRDQARTAFAARLSLLPAAQQKKFNNRRVVYVQNVLDTHHYEQHFKPFCAAADIDPVAANTDSFSVILFSHPDGHAKAETDEEFRQAVDYVMHRGADERR